MPGVPEPAAGSRPERDVAGDAVTAAAAAASAGQGETCAARAAGIAAEVQGVPAETAETGAVLEQVLSREHRQDTVFSGEGETGDKPLSRESGQGSRGGGGGGVV